MKTHDLKIWGIFFNAVVNGKKNFEIRKMDRDYESGDFIRLREWDRRTDDYTGRECTAMITYIYRADDYMKNGFGVLGIKLVSNTELHQSLNEIEQGLEYDKRVGPFVQKFRELDHQVQTDRFFRHHLSTELDKFAPQLNPELRDKLDKLLIKLSAKERYDL